MVDAYVLSPLAKVGRRPFPPVIPPSPLHRWPTPLHGYPTPLHRSFTSVHSLTLGSYAIGANDVANSFSTAVASKTITMKTAVIIAIFMEFGGAFLLGSATAETIRSGIVDLTYFQQNPNILMLGMWCALIGSSTWVLLATSFGLPVSTTHSIVGGVMGMGIASFGLQCVYWGMDGFARIAITWVTSPLISGIVAALIYLSVKYLVLIHENSFERGLRMLPVYFFITITVMIEYILFKGMPNLPKPADMSPSMLYGFIFGGIGFGLLMASWAWFFYCPWIRRVLIDDEDLKWYHVFYTPWVPIQPKRKVAVTVWGAERQDAEKKDAEGLESQGSETVEVAAAPVELTGWKKYWKKARDGMLHGMEVEVANHEAEKYAYLVENSVEYESKTEELYSFLQVFTCSVASFAHGSNDVANAIGPLCVIYQIWNEGADCIRLGKKTPVPLWILCVGGIFIDLGLATYGYKVMRSLGNHLTHHTPSRGFSMELGNSLTILTASFIGMPVSSTQSVTGATAFVGVVASQSFKGLNWKLLAWCFLSWFITVPAAAIVSFCFMSMFVHAPTMFVG